MLSKSFWFRMAVAVMGGALLLASADAKPKKRKNKDYASGPPTLSLSADQTTVRACEGDSARVQLFANAHSSSRMPLRFKWTTNGGRLTGSGANTTWDLAGAQPGVYQAVVDVDDGTDLNCVAFASLAVVVTDCPPVIQTPTCPTVTVSCPDSATETAPVTFSATVSGGSGATTPSYNWTVSNGHITSGQGTTSITVDTAGLAGQTIRATLDVGGYGMPCPASCTVSIPIDIKPRKFDEYYDIARNDEKARLDNYAIQLQSEPGAKGYIIVHAKRGAGNAASVRADRIKDYLINTRGMDASRFDIVMGTEREDWLFELWIVPPGAQPPVPQD